MISRNIQESAPRDFRGLGSRSEAELNCYGPSKTYSSDVGYLQANGLVNGSSDPQPREPNSLIPIVNGHDEGDSHTKNSSRRRLFLLSSLDQKGGRSQAKSLSTYLVDRLHGAQDQLLDDLAYTLGERRSRFGYKAVIAASSVPELIERLDDGSVKFARSSGKKGLAYVFTGQGAQWHAMGLELMWTYPIFYKSLVRASKWLNTLGASWDLIGNTISSQKILSANLIL